MTLSSVNTSSPAPEEEPSIDLRQYLALFRQWWWLITLAALLAGAAAYLYSRQLTPIYAASTTLLVNEAVGVSSADYSSLMTNQMLAQTYAQIITARPVMEKVAARLGTRATRGVPMDPEAMAGMVTVTQVRDTQLLVVSVESENPQLSADIANGVAQVFGEQVQETQRSRFAASEENLQKQMADAQVQIDQIRQSLAGLQDLANANDQAEKRERCVACTCSANTCATPLAISAESFGSSLSTLTIRSWVSRTWVTVTMPAMALGSRWMPRRTATFSITGRAVMICA